MAARQDIAEIQKHITNIIDAGATGDKKIAGIAGEAPSRYSKSPALWNGAFVFFGLDAVYLPFDADEFHLAGLVSALRDSERFIGANVTVPHKVRIMEFLDELDAGARRVGAVNTVVRTPAGRLIGYNTDGEGFIASLQKTGFIESMEGIDVLLLGAGGSARAVAFQAADLLGRGQLVICNRTLEHAESLAAEIRAGGRRARAIAENEISTWAPRAGLIINSTTKGQGGIRKLAGGKITNLEPYSALSPAQPPAFAERDFQQKWPTAAQADIGANNQASMSLAKSIPQTVRFYDLIYHPEETVFLRHGRLTGHRTMNGKGMIIHQAATAFTKHICRIELQKLGKDDPQTYRQIADVMSGAWYTP